MNPQIYLIKGIYPDRVVILFGIGSTSQSIIVGFSELSHFFEEQQIRYIVAGDNFEIMEIKPRFELGKGLLTLPGE